MKTIKAEKQLVAERINMTQRVQELIDKIKSEGVQAAERSANAIREKATMESEAVMESAKKRAQQIIADAEAEAEQMQKSTRLALKQAARDTLLSLRKEIQTILNNLVKDEVAAVLDSNKLAAVIEAATMAAVRANTSENDVKIEVNQDDLNAVQKGLLTKLQQHIKGGVQLQASGAISRGFTISFDGGKSCFEFTDGSLAEYIGSFLNTELSELVKDSVELK